MMDAQQRPTHSLGRAALSSFATSAFSVFVWRHVLGHAVRKDSR